MRERLQVCGPLQLVDDFDPPIASATNAAASKCAAMNAVATRPASPYKAIDMPFKAAD